MTEQAAPADERWQRWLPEIGLVAIVGFVELGITALIGQHGPEDARGPLGLAGVALLLTGVLALPWRRRYPSGVLAIVLVATTAYWSLGYTRGPIWLALVIALVYAVLAGRRRAAIIALVVGFLANTWLAYLIDRGDAPAVPEVVALAAWLVALVSLAEAWRNHRDRRAEQERSHAEALRRRASEERLRIARELHDVVAHNISLISIQAGVALHLMDSRPEQVRSSLATIKDASKETLMELRSILGVLRQVDEDDEPDDDLDTPRPADGDDDRAGDSARDTGWVTDDDRGSAAGKRVGQPNDRSPGAGEVSDGAAGPDGAEGDRRGSDRSSDRDGDRDRSGSAGGPAAGSTADRPGPAQHAGARGSRRTAPRSPVPGLHRLDDLVTRARAAGLDIRLEMPEDLAALRALPRQVDLAAFRIVQESLTNVARHSDDPAATVRIEAQPGGLAVTVVDEGSGRPPAGPLDDLPAGGNGLVGMRERAASVGGSLDAGPRPGRGFAVRAWLPIGDIDRSGGTGSGSSASPPVPNEDELEGRQA